MKSKNKPRQTADEKQHVARVASLETCVVCGDKGPVEIHEPEQGLWWLSLPLCTACHRGAGGWHGTRLRWTLNKMSELKAINQTHEMLAGQ